jgi:hypothetical protein
VAGHGQLILDKALKLEIIRSDLRSSLANFQVGRETQTHHPWQSETKRI